MRILFLLIGAVLLVSSGDARADGTAILISGTAPKHELELSRSAMAASVQAQGGKLVHAPFTAKDASLVKKCLSNTTPWACMKAAVAAKGIDQLVVGSVDTGTSPMGAPAIRLSGYLVVASLDYAIAEERHCDPCTDDMLANLAGELTQAQLRRLAVVRGRTWIAVRTTPRGAHVTLDGEVQGASDAVIPTYPGTHTVRLELDGHAPETRSVEAIEGQTIEVSVPLRPKSGAGDTPLRPPPSRPSSLVPIVLSMGAAALITGGMLIAVHDPHGPDLGPREEYYYATRTPGIVTAISGALAVTVGLYLWRRQSRSSVTAAPLTRGAAVGWSTTF
jgi:PEGA domain